MTNKGQTFPPEVYTRDEIDRFLATFTHSFTGRRNHAIFLLAFRCQLRCDEILSLRKSDLDHDKGSITVMAGKGGKRRVVGVDVETIATIKRLGHMSRHDSPLIFHSNNGNRLDNSYVRKLAKRHGLKADITKRVAPHCFRHSGAVFLSEAGVNINIIRRQLGHSSLSITQRYIDHLSSADVVDAVQEVSW